MLRPGTQDTLIRQRVNMPTAQSHAELVREVAPKIKAQAFFSARVAEAHILDRLRAVSDAYSRGEIGLGEARNTLKDFLRAEGYDDPRQAGMRNLASTGRLNLILKQNAAMANAAAEWKRMHDPDAMRVFPYVRYHARGDKRTRGEHAALDGKIFAKDDPFLSTHTPPWEFNCRCWLEEITAQEAGRTPELIQEPTPPEKVKVESGSGFSFDPAHAFEKYDYSLVKDPGLREETREGVTRILAGQSDGADQSDGAGAPAGTGGSSGWGKKPEPLQFMRQPQEKNLEEHVAELERRVAEESGNKVFPKEPNEFLKGDDLDKAEAEARKAVPSEVMDEVDQKVREIGKEGLRPFMHYSSRPEDSENAAVRKAAYHNGVIDWTGVEISEARKKAVAELHHLLDIMPKFHGTVYRGCAFDNEDDVAEYIEKLLRTPEKLTGFISTTPDPVVAHRYASSGAYKVVIVVPNCRNAVYFGPYSTHPEDEESLINYDFYLKALDKYEKDGIIYVIAEEKRR